MAIDLRFFTGGGQYIPREYFIDQTVNFPAITPSTDVITLEAPAGLRVRLEDFYTSSQNDVYSIILDDNIILLNNEILANSQNTSQGFRVRQNSENGPSYGDYFIKDIIANKIVVRFINGEGTTPTISYSYDYSYGV